MDTELVIHAAEPGEPMNLDANEQQKEEEERDNLKSKLYQFTLSKRHNSTFHCFN